MTSGGKVWFGVAPGPIGETLWPNGLEIVETFDENDDADREAKFLSSIKKRPYRVILITEIAVHESPAMDVIQGEGRNPIDPALYQQMRDGIRESKLAKKK